MTYEAFMHGREDRDSFRSRGEKIERLTRERDEARREAAESARRGGECAKDRSVLAEQLVEAP